jgi:hypothetical protein
MLRALPRHLVDTSLRRIVEVSQRDRADAPHMCQLCRRVVGSKNLAVCLWPPKSTADSTWQMGRARLCESCVAETHPKIRVHARAWRSTYESPGQKGNRIARENRAALKRGRSHNFSITPSVPPDERPRANW